MLTGKGVGRADDRLAPVKGLDLGVHPGEVLHGIPGYYVPGEKRNLVKK